MTAEELLVRWAEKKWGLTNVVRVEFEHTPGQADFSTLTPGWPEEQLVIVHFDAGTTRTYSDVWLTTDLINEILTSDQG